MGSHPLDDDAPLPDLQPRKFLYVEVYCIHLKSFLAAEANFDDRRLRAPRCWCNSSKAKHKQESEDSRLCGMSCHRSGNSNRAISTAEVASKTIHHESIGPVMNQLVFRMTAAAAVPSTAGSEPDVDVQGGEIAKDEPVRMPVDREISGLVAISTRTSLQLRSLKALVHIQGSLPNRPLCKLRLISLLLLSDQAI